MPPKQSAQLIFYVFTDAEVVERSDDIFDHLARQKLIRDPPSLIQPSQIPAYADRADIAKLYFGLWVARRKDGAHFDAFPQINLYPSIVLERRDGQLLAVVDHLRPRITVPHKYDALPSHIVEVEQNAALLLHSVHTEANVALLSIAVDSISGIPITGGLFAQAGSPQPVRFLKSSGDA